MVKCRSIFQSILGLFLNVFYTLNGRHFYAYLSHIIRKIIFKLRADACMFCSYRSALSVIAQACLILYWKYCSSSVEYWASTQVFFFQTYKHGYEHTLLRLKKPSYFTEEWVKMYIYIYIDTWRRLALPTSINRHLNFQEFGFLLWTCLAFFIQNVLHICKHLKEELKGSKMKKRWMCIISTFTSTEWKQKCYLGAKRQRCCGPNCNYCLFYYNIMVFQIFPFMHCVI